MTAHTETHYRHILEELGKKDGMLGIIFRKAQNKIQDPAKLKRLIADLIDREKWSMLDADVKGNAYEGLLEKNAQDTKGGAGQYFTPRPLIQAIVDCVRPQPGETIGDPACGTAGFLLAAHEFIVDHNPNLDKDQKKHLKLRRPARGRDRRRRDPAGRHEPAAARRRPDGQGGRAAGQDRRQPAQRPRATGSTWC